MNKFKRTTAAFVSIVAIMFAFVFVLAGAAYAGDEGSQSQEENAATRYKKNGTEQEATGGDKTVEDCRTTIQSHSNAAGTDWPYGYWQCYWNEALQKCVCDYARDYSCFPPETKILMGDGSLRRIDNVFQGDYVWNPARGKAMRVGNRLAGPEKKPLYEVGYEGGTVRVTETHPMVVSAQPEFSFENTALGYRSSERNARVKRAMDLSLDDAVLGKDGAFHKITVLRVAPLDEGQIVWNFELETESKALEDHMIVAEGIATGDVTVQARLNNYKLPWEKAPEVQ